MSASPRSEIDSPTAWARLSVCLVLGTIGSIGMWSFAVVLPAVQRDFGIVRADASLPYTLSMIGFAFGSVAMGRLSDRLGPAAPASGGALLLAMGYVGAGYAPNIWLLALAYGTLGFGSAATFGPLMADISHWFARRRGIAVALASCGNYLAGTLWPPLIQHYIAASGWRPTHIGIGALCLVSMLPLALMLRRPPPKHDIVPAQTAARGSLGVSSNVLMGLLCIAGVGCCVAMAMPQVHIVAYCGDLGYGIARGAQILSVMLGFGLISRVACGFIADRIGGVATLLLSSFLQGVSLLFYLFFDSLASLFVISALFGLFQGGLVPMYTLVVRQYFAPQEVGARVGIVLMATVFGMALGGWMSGAIFDWTGAYWMAFLNGLIWNLLNFTIVLWLFLRPGRRLALAG